jgi:hypothetical protein
MMVYSSETLGSFYRTRRRHFLENRIVHNTALLVYADVSPPQCMKTANRSIKNDQKFKYLERDIPKKKPLLS